MAKVLGPFARRGRRAAALLTVLALGAAAGANAAPPKGSRTYSMGDGSEVTFTDRSVTTRQGTLRSEVPTMVGQVPIPDLIKKKLDALEVDPLPGTFARLDGYADLHLHQFAQLGFDGRLLHGDAAAAGAVEAALPSCTVEPSVSGVVMCGKLFANTLTPQLLALCAIALPFLNMPYEHVKSSHGINFVSDIVAGWGDGYSVYNAANHPLLLPFSSGQLDGGTASSGTPFRDWPLWYGMGHQQAGRAHLKEAHADGLRLIVMSAVNNEFLCKALPSGNGIAGAGGCADMLNLSRQLTAAWNFAAANSDWYEIALTPGEAARIVSEGKIAVVLSVEASNVFNAATTGGGAVNRGVLGNLLFELGTTLGVRSILPVHEFNSSLGGAAQQAKLLRTIEKTGDTFENGAGFISALLTSIQGPSNAPPLNVDDQDPACGAERRQALSPARGVSAVPGPS